MSEYIPPKCKYWTLEVFCKYWDHTATICTYSGVYTDQKPSYYPFCNFMGSESRCTAFSKVIEETDTSKASAYRCSLVNPDNSIGNYLTSTRWAFMLVGEDGNNELDTSLITGYTNLGFKCKFSEISGEGKDEAGGTNIRCSGYNPSHMAFGVIAPTNEQVTSSSKFKNFQVPLNYKMLGVRAKLSTCYWWRGDTAQFVLNSVQGTQTPFKEIQAVMGPTFSGLAFPTVEIDKGYGFIGGCRRIDTQEYLDPNFTNIPCNGAHDKCPYYTGICWEYVKNDKLLYGDKVLAEQVLELRYYLYGSNWDINRYNDYFIEPSIISWLGSYDYMYNMSKENHNLAVTYNVVSNSITFDRKFYISYNVYTIEEGTEALPHNNRVPTSNFPTLIREVHDFLLSPIILSKFLSYDDFFSGTLVVYETAVLDPFITLLGDTHTLVYDIVCVNLDLLDFNPDIVADLQHYGDINEIYMLLWDDQQTEGDNPFYFFQERVNTFVEELRNIYSGACFENYLEDDDKAFLFDVKVKYGSNNLLVLAKYRHGTSDKFYWGFSFYQLFCKYTSVLLKQTEFSLTKKQSALDAFGRPKVADRLFDYRRSFHALDSSATVSVVYLQNKEKTFPFPRINHKEFFNDYRAEDLLDQDVLYVGCRTYELSRSYLLGYDHLFQIGSSGYVLVELPDEDGILTSAYSAIGVDTGLGLLYLEYPTEDGEPSLCELVLVKRSIRDGLLDNQLLFKAKNISNFRSICKNTKLYIDRLYFKIKSNNILESTAIPGFLVTDITSRAANIVGAFKTEEAGRKTFIIKDFVGTVNLSVPVRGISGAVVSIARIKIAVWIKQPKVPDIEIFYNWSAEYGYYRNFPVCMCCGAYHCTLIKTITVSNTPDCGDHDVSPYTYQGPMWYPYVQCQPYSTYNKISNQAYDSLMEVKGLYKETDSFGDRVHGSWDMRMEGPALNMFSSGDYCCSICACACTSETFNIKRLSDSTSYFSGFARYRGEVFIDTLMRWSATGGQVPKFGNVLRPRLESYRATDYVQYLYISYRNPDTFQTKWIWMPSVMSFAGSDFVEQKDVVYSDFLETPNAGIINGLGTMLFNYLDGEPVGEVVLEERFRFEDVFDVFLSTNKLAYPKPVGDYAQEHIPVQQYRRIQQGDIQYAWREFYLDIERNIDQQGRLCFLTLGKLDYKFDKFGIEHRLVTDEGETELVFIAPELDGQTGEYKFPGTPKLKLGAGPQRSLGWDNVFYTAPDDDVDYDELTSPPWEDVSLFDADYVVNTEDAEYFDRKIVTNLDGSDITTYYNRGIRVDRISFKNSSRVPTKFERIPINDIVGYSDVEIQSDSGQPTGRLRQDFLLSFAGKKKAISKIEFMFKFGTYYDNERSEESSLFDFYKIYVVPNIVVPGLAESSAHIPQHLGISNKQVVLDFVIPLELLVRRADTFSFSFAFDMPKNDRGEIVSHMALPRRPGRTVVCTYVIEIVPEQTSFYDTVIVDKIEKIYVHERRYRVSVASTSVSQPPHGVNLGRRVLKPRFDDIELDTVWQRDRDGEVVDLPNSRGDVSFIHKMRSSILREGFTDMQPVLGSIHEAEQEQARLYNDFVPLYQEYPISFTSVIYPTLTPFFDLCSVFPVTSRELGRFVNDSLFRIGTLVDYPKMQPKGHLLLPSAPWHEVCSKYTRGREGCNGDDTFNYIVYNMDDGTTRFSRYTGAEIFYRGTLYLIQRLHLAHFLVTKLYTKYDVGNTGKIFEEGDSIEYGLPEYEAVPGMYSSGDWYYTARKPRSRWPHIIPSLWQIFGKLEDYVP